MAVLKVYPHEIIVTTTTSGTDGYTDEEGYYHKGTEGKTSTQKIACQAVPSTTPNNVITYDDGHQVEYSYSVLLDRNCREFVRGENVTLNLLNGVSHNLTVKDFYRYQSNAKLWV